MRAMRSAAPALLFLLTLSACGDDDRSPAAPTPAPASLSGTWSGTATLVYMGQRVTGAFANAATLTQSGDQLSGTLNAADGSSGGFAGTMSGSTFTGTLRIEIVQPGTRCRGTADHLTGPVAQNTITLTAPTMTLENCPGSASNVELRLTR
jgi:hypothetical protein